MPLSAALNAAKQRARWLMSTPTTRPAWPCSSRASWPLPVPTSRALPTGARIVSRSRTWDGRCELDRRGHEIALAPQDAHLDEAVELDVRERRLRLVCVHFECEQEKLHLRPECPDPSSSRR